MRRRSKVVNKIIGKGGRVLGRGMSGNVKERGTV